jgi:hypothetical protein
MSPLILGPILDVAGKVFDRLFPDKEKAEQAKLELLREAGTQEFQLALEQVKVNLEEAKHPSVFVSGWRPAIGWTCAAGLFWNFLGYPMATWAAAMWKQDFNPPPLVSDHLLELTLGMLGLAGLRAWEKYKGVARN